MNELSIIAVPSAPNKILFKFIDNLSIHLITNPSDVEVILLSDKKNKDPGTIMEYVRNKYPWLKVRLLFKSGDSATYGALVRFGLAYSTSRYAVLVSPYGEDDVGIIMKMLNIIREDPQIVQATRYASGLYDKNVKLRYRIYQQLYRILVRIFVGEKSSDSTYSFKMFDRIFIQSLGLTQNGMAISSEITFKGLLAGGKVSYYATKIIQPSTNLKFKLYKEGLGYFWLLIRSILHRMKIYWF